MAETNRTTVGVELVAINHTERTVIFATPQGERSVRLSDLWRDEALIASLPADTAFRVGYEAGFQRDREMRAAVVPESNT